MALTSSDYLNTVQTNIRARPIPWDGAVRAGNLTEDQLQKIKAVDKVRKEVRKQVIELDLEGYSTLLVGGPSGGSVLEKAAKRVDLLQYILVLATDLVTDVPALAAAIVSRPSPYKLIIGFLSRSSKPDDGVPLHAATLLIALVSASITASTKPQPRDDEVLPQLYSYLANLVKHDDAALQDLAVQQYSLLLRSKRSKELFWKQRGDTVAPLFNILRKATGSAKDNDSTVWSGAASVRSIDTRFGGGVGLQLMYHVLLVIWQLSFEAELVGVGLEEDEEVVSLYTQLLRVSPKEKTTRLLLSTLNFLLSANQERLIPAATTARLPALLSNLSARHLSDPDLIEDLNELKTMLDEYTKNQTTFDEYADEVRSGRLHWSPPHRNATFWRENARRILEDKQGELAKKLAEILAKPWDSDKQVLAIGSNDVGNLVREVPEQRATLEALGLKVRIMELMTDTDESVRWEALKALGEWLRYSTDRGTSTRHQWAIAVPSSPRLVHTQPFQTANTVISTTPPSVVRRKPLPSSATLSPPQIRLEATASPETVHRIAVQKSNTDANATVNSQHAVVTASSDQVASAISDYYSDSDDERPLICTAQPLRISSLPNSPIRAGKARLSTLRISRSVSKELEYVAANASRATAAEDDDIMPLRPAPLRTSSLASLPSQQSPDRRKPPTPAGKFTAFFTRKQSTSSINESAEADARSPLPSPYAVSSNSGHRPGFRVPSWQRSQDSLHFDPSVYAEMAPTMERAAVLETELQDISRELAASIKREMDLEDLVERLQAEGPPTLPHIDDRTSDYFSDSGASSVRPLTSDIDPRQEIDKVKRDAEQQRAHLKLGFSQRLQRELATRKAVEMDLQQVLQRLSTQSRQETESQDMSVRVKELEKRLKEERRSNSNFENLLTALRAEMEQHRNERDNLRDEVVPQLKATIEGLEAGLAEAQKSPYDLARMQHEIQSLRDENQALQSARIMNAPFEAVPEGEREAATEPAQPSTLLGAIAGGLQRSTTISLGRSPSRATLNRTRSVSRVNAQDQPQNINIPEQLKQVEQQRDALHDTVRYLLRRQALQNRVHEKNMQRAKREIEQARAESQQNVPRKGGYEKEVQVLRAEINLLRRRADDAMDQKWKCEKGLAGLKLDLDRSKQETESLQRLLRARDSNTPEALSAQLEDALRQLQAHNQAAQTQGCLRTLDSEQSIANELEQSTERTEALAAQVRKQLKTNAGLRDRLKETIEKGERDQQASAAQINELQRRLQSLQDTLTSAQLQSESAVMKHEEEVRLLRTSTNVQLLRPKHSNSNLLSPTPRSPLSPMFANIRKSPRLDQTTSGPGMALHQTLQTDELERKVTELEKALADTDAEMGEVIGRMNAAQMGVAELEAERDEALRQTRQLEQKIRMLVGGLALPQAQRDADNTKEPLPEDYS
ncbi:hypothetical protein DV738_g4896, partial [Chaetothyriales sp. CBS 135597]